MDVFGLKKDSKTKNPDAKLTSLFDYSSTDVFANAKVEKPAVKTTSSGTKKKTSSLFDDDDDDDDFFANLNTSIHYQLYNI